MINKKFPIIFLLILLCSVNVFSQTFISGEVVEIFDGRTLVVRTSKNQQVNVRLQYIEVPEPEQPLAAIVVDHLKNLALGKLIRFRASSVTGDTIPGRVFVGEVDLSQQMLRDGAAWFTGSEVSRVEIEISNDYQAMETAAKVENRGVWGIAGMKTPREFRKEKQLAKSLEEEKKLEEIRKASFNAREQSAPKNKFSENKQVTSTSIFDSLDPNLVLEYDREKNEGFISSPMNKFEVSDGGKSVEIVLGFGYEFTGTEIPKGGENFGIVVGSISIGTEFLRANPVTVFTDSGKKIEIGKPKTKSTIQNGEVLEVLFYQISRDELIKLSEDKTPSLKIGEHQRILTRPIQNIIKIVLQATK